MLIEQTVLERLVCAGVLSLPAWLPSLSAHKHNRHKSIKTSHYYSIIINDAVRFFSLSLWTRGVRIKVETKGQRPLGSTRHCAAARGLAISPTAVYARTRRRLLFCRTAALCTERSSGIRAAGLCARVWEGDHHSGTD